MVVLSSVVQVPVELEKLFVVLEHDLPAREQLHEIARGIATEDGELPDGAELDMLLDAAAGLTRYEAESAFSACRLVRHGRIVPDAVWDLKCQTLKKSGLLQLYRGSEDFSSLGGLASLKAFTKRALLQPSRSNPLKRPRGVLLLSPPGCGKSRSSASALASETGRPMLILDVGTLMGSLGRPDRGANPPGLADRRRDGPVRADDRRGREGVRGRRQLRPDRLGRVGADVRLVPDLAQRSRVRRVRGLHRQRLAKLPPEFARAERFDGIFFLDFPGREQKQAIWDIYLDLFELDRDQKLPNDEQWTGAEIRACCRLAALLDVPLVQAAQNVVPVAVTAAESVERLRTWASGRCLDADRGGIYQGDGAKSTARRKVSRNPLNN